MFATRRARAHTHTLRIGCTELKAVPHAGLGYHFLRVQVKPNGGWGSSNGSEAQSASTKSTSSDRQDDGGPCTSAELKGINGHQLRLTMRPGAPSRYVFTTAWMGLRWPMPSKCPWAPCFDMKLKGKPNKSKRIPMIPRVTHTRLPEGRHLCPRASLRLVVRPGTPRSTKVASCS